MLTEKESTLDVLNNVSGMTESMCKASKTQHLIESMKMQKSPIIRAVSS
jgi:hypothetical protein